ncbi:lamin tail domain-containing protein [Streptomyces sp. G-G2]|uniref:lamin tail domain-containing protein n=1 Tax=Streptomyces sp. G-G2 TaxID=3046201 RepID=UPI0024BB9674|nr:lamin tail domain-containing protein [Streptomyces sp. G-G2]MDJ0384556.1 lamin tail domain-containing protein [Streptomyces sp. G-G2]
MPRARARYDLGPLAASRSAPPRIRIPTAVSLKGWTLTDASNHTYTFATFTLGAGKAVTVKTGKGTNTATPLFQQRAADGWNNDKDTATLRRAPRRAADQAPLPRCLLLA